MACESADRKPLADGLVAAVGPFFGEVDQVELAGRSALGGEERRRLCSVLRPVVHDVHEHLPDGHPLVDVLRRSRPSGSATRHRPRPTPPPNVRAARRSSATARVPARVLRRCPAFRVRCASAGKRRDGGRGCRPGPARRRRPSASTRPGRGRRGRPAPAGRPSVVPNRPRTSTRRLCQGLCRAPLFARATSATARQDSTVHRTTLQAISSCHLDLTRSATSLRRLPSVSHLSP